MENIQAKIQAHLTAVSAEWPSQPRSKLKVPKAIWKRSLFLIHGGNGEKIAHFSELVDVRISEKMFR